MPTRYGRSPWIDRFPKSRVPALSPLPRRDQNRRRRRRRRADRLRDRVRLCRRRRQGHAARGRADRSGHTAYQSGWISEEPGVRFADLEKAIGARGAGRAFQMWRRAALDFAALLRRLDVKCDLATAPGADGGADPGTDGAAETRAEDARAPPASTRRCLRAAPWQPTSRSTPARGSARRTAPRSIRTARASALAAAAAARGVQLFERSPVVKVTFGRKDAEVFTAGGRIRAARVVVATGMPTALFKSLARHFWFRTSYLALTAPVPAEDAQQALGRRDAVMRDLADPPHTVRWVGDQRLLVAGAERPQCRRACATRRSCSAPAS